MQIIKFILHAFFLCCSESSGMIKLAYILDNQKQETQIWSIDMLVYPHQYLIMTYIEVKKLVIICDNCFRLYMIICSLVRFWSGQIEKLVYPATLPLAHIIKEKQQRAWAIEIKFNVSVQALKLVLTIIQLKPCFLGIKQQSLTPAFQEKI